MPSAASPRATKRERRAHVLGHGEFRLGRRPGAELLQRRLGVLADRHGAHVAGGDAAVAGELGEVETGPIVTSPIFESFGAIRTSRLPSRFTRVSSLISFFCEP